MASLFNANAAINLHRNLSSKNNTKTYTEQSYKQIFNPLGIIHKVNKTDIKIPKTDLDNAADPGMNLIVEHYNFNTDSDTDFDSDSDHIVEKYELDYTRDHLQNIYMESLKARAIAVNNFCLNSESYKPWLDNWKFLKYNLVKKNKLTFEQLSQSDQDIAYVVDKGRTIRFRIHDKEKFMPINIYQYVLYHEMAHMSTKELQHTPKFHELLNLLSLAAYEIGLIDLKRISKTVFTTNGQCILSAESLQDEIILGCNHMLKYHANNPKITQYYIDLRQHIAKRI